MCSVLRSERICVRRVAHVVGHSGLNVGESVIEVVHNVRSLLYHKMFREFQVQDVLYLQTPSVTVDCRQL